MLKGLIAFWKKAKPARRAAAVLWIMGLAVTALQLVLPEQVGRLTNLFAAQGQSVSWSQINLAVAWLVGSQVVIAMFNYYRGRLMDRSRDRLVRDATMQMYYRLLRFDADFFRDHDAEVINSRVLEDLRNAVTFWFDLLLKLPLLAGSILVYGAFMVYTNAFFALCLIPLCFLSGYFLIFDKRMRAVNRANHSAWDKVRVQAKEYVGSVEEIRPNNAFGYGLRLLDQAFHRYHDVTDEPVTVFFDGAGAPPNAPKAESGAAVEVLFSRAGQTADQMIERAAHRFQPHGEVLVVTDDRAERDTVNGFGDSVSGCANFIRMIEGALTELQDELRNHNRMERTRFKRRPGAT